MGKQLVEKMIPALNKIELPKGETATTHGRKTYEVGLDKVDSYKGDPQTLLAALRIFQTGDSRPYACAGVAYTLLAAAQEKDGSYAQNGLDAAMTWLEKAQALELDITEINVIEAFIYLYSGRFDDARLILDYLQQQDSMDPYLHRAEVIYWQTQKNVKETTQWYEQALQSAETVPQRLRLQAQIADFYADQNMLDEALALYKELAHFDPQNPWMWHKKSVLYWRRGELEDAEHCNQRALKLQDFPEARQMEAAIRKKKFGSGVLGRLFSRSDET